MPPLAPYLPNLTDKQLIDYCNSLDLNITLADKGWCSWMRDRWVQMRKSVHYEILKRGI